MTWFTASFISATKDLDHEKGGYLAYEDYYLFEANSQQEYDAKLDKAIEELKMKYTDCIYQHKQMQVEYVGIRKILTITNNSPNFDKDEDPPNDDCVLSYNFLTTENLEQAKQYAQGKAVNAYYIDSDHED